MQVVEIHPNAADDIRQIAKIDRVSAAKVTAVLSQMGADGEFQDRLLDHQSKDNGVEVQRWLAQFNQGNNLYRLKVWYPVDGFPLRYRIIYGYLPIEPGRSKSCYIILGVVDRDGFNYGTTTETERRVLRDYDRLK